MRTDYLFAMPSVWSGAARVLDLFGVFDAYNDSDRPELADARAIYSDWRITGQDLAGAMMAVEGEWKTARPAGPANAGARRDP